jgi:F-type H+-transporting ATPase subunit delta|uniref:ATP synthase delta chain, chloroplastic n=1 Tax=Picea sitchensis TaxID=3332 RepID=D5A7U9_PICSI|nr:unknown [Picea sitchensis]
MDTLTQSLATLNVHSRPPAQVLQSREPVQLLPAAILSPRSRSSRPFAPAHLTISKKGIEAAFKNSYTLDALASRIPQANAESPVRRAVVVMRESAAGGYAAALLQFAQANNMLEMINGDMEKLSHLLKNRELYDFLINPITENGKKKSILKSIADDAKFQTYTLNFLNLLISKQKIGIVNNILKEFESLYNELTDTQVAFVSSALKLENRELAQIAKKIQSLTGARNVKLKCIIDSSLIAGFVIRFGKDASRIIDMSVKSRLELLSAPINSTEKVGAFGI